MIKFVIFDFDGVFTDGKITFDNCGNIIKSYNVKDGMGINNLIKKYSFGGGVVNDTVIHFSNTNLPFGGIGTSGNGSYHGKYSFDIFTHAKPLVRRPFWFDLPQRYAPYPKSLKFLKFLLKKL